MASEPGNSRKPFQWEPQPAAATLVSQLIERFLAANDDIARLARRMGDETGTRLVDWVDSIFLPPGFEDSSILKELSEVGFRSSEKQPHVWNHPGGIFPAILTGAPDYPGWEPKSANLSLAIKIDNAEDFVQAHRLEESSIFGQPGSRLRMVFLAPRNETRLVAMERHGWRGYSMPEDSSDRIASAKKHYHLFSTRNRTFNSSEAGFDYCANIIQAAVDEIGADWTCSQFFAAERDYWMSRNQAGRVQYGRQQQLGLGWANHDHHTFRSSRASFHRVVSTMQLMGFQCRERFYAGREAGWGAQVFEQPNCGIVVFSDVDLLPEEAPSDFAHQPLPSRDELGTVGLWCALHGEAFLEAGMHHLECQFDFDEARRQLAAAGVETMAPFTDFSFLKQAFTQGEIWPVEPIRIDALLAGEHLSPELAEQFRREGALGSHLELLERNDGYKGFNQTGVSDIILRTDPRKS